VPVIYWLADGCGKGVNDVARHLTTWIGKQGDAECVIYGGDVYDRGKADEFAQVPSQLGDLSKVAALPGNHDWKTVSSDAGVEFPREFDAFWRDHAPPLSKRPLELTKTGSARYDCALRVGDWDLILVDTAVAGEDEGAWPKDDAGRIEWLESKLAGPGRSRILFTHHSRLSSGSHDDQPGIDSLWRQLFDPNTGTPRVALTVAGHDHNCSLYEPRLANSSKKATGSKVGVWIHVNGAGGRYLVTHSGGTTPDRKYGDGFCVTRIQLLSAKAAELDLFSFGDDGSAEPVRIPEFHVRIDV